MPNSSSLTKKTVVLLAALNAVMTMGLIFAGAPESPPDFTAAPAIYGNPNKSVPLAAVVRFATDKPVRTTIQVSDGSRQWELKYGESWDTATGLPVVGMRPNRKHEICLSIRGVEGNGAPSSYTFQYRTPPLPMAGTEFPPIKINASRPAMMEPGITLMSVRREARGRGGQGAGNAPGQDFSRKYGLLLGLDAAGEVVWYYLSDSRISDFKHLRSGNFVYLTEDFRAIEIDILGNVVGQWYAGKRPQGPAEGIAIDTFSFHHAIEETVSGNLLVLGSDLREISNYYSSETDPAAPRGTQQVMGDEIVEFHHDGKVVWRWNCFDHLDIDRLGYLTFNRYWETRGFPGARDWTHGNGLWYDEGDAFILFNSRQQSSVFKIERPSGRVQWIFGEPGGWSERFLALLFRPAGAITWPWHFHASSLTPSGNVLLFDNGINKARPFDPPVPRAQVFSRAAEYAIDPAKKTTLEAWSSEGPGPGSVLSFAMGDADYLPQTGNVLICYGDATLRGGTPPKPQARVREVSHASPPEVLFEVVLAEDSGDQSVTWAIFGSERLPRLVP